MSNLDRSADALSALGVATVYEASGRNGLIAADLVQVVPGSHAAGPARTVLCGQDDNRGVHEALERSAPGEVLVITMPQPAPIALVGDLLALQAQVRGVAALLVDAAVRDHDELLRLGLPIWARWIRAAGAGKNIPGTFNTSVTVGGQAIADGDYVVMDADGAIVVGVGRLADVIDKAQRREESEERLRERIGAGELTLDLLGLRST
jgi:4-hydroxy-4-methyl-2-oxoglutarate aldolase